MTNSKSFLIDTNYILRYLLLNDPKFNSIVQVFFDLIRTGDQHAIVLDAVIAECVYVLSHGYDIAKSDVASSLKGLLLYKGIICPQKDHLFLALDTWSSHQLDFVDCMLYATSIIQNIPLHTFDAKLKRLCNEQKTQNQDS